jgi:hypothetical protein
MSRQTQDTSRINAVRSSKHFLSRTAVRLSRPSTPTSTANPTQPSPLTDGRARQALPLTRRFFDNFFSRIKIKCMMYFNHRARLFTGNRVAGIEICNGCIKRGLERGPDGRQKAGEIFLRESLVTHSKGSIRKNKR